MSLFPLRTFAPLRPLREEFFWFSERDQSKNLSRQGRNGALPAPPDGPSPARLSRRKRILRIVLLVAAGAFVLAIPLGLYGWHEAQDLRVRRFSLPCPNLPPAFDGYRIVFASDFHVRNRRPVHRKALDTFARLEGDILVLGGDYQYLRSWNPAGGMAFLDDLGRLAGRYPDGIVAVRGNHDRDRMRAFLQRHPTIRYISGGAHVVTRGGASIAFAGIYRSAGLAPRRMALEVQRAAAAIPDAAAFRILVSHWPDFFPLAKGRFDLMLAGDTHGGQIRLPWIGAPFKKTKLAQHYAWGLVDEGGTMLYTTSGVGAQLPLRINCPPEIVVLELKSGAGW